MEKITARWVESSNYMNDRAYIRPHYALVSDRLNEADISREDVEKHFSGEKHHAGVEECFYIPEVTADGFIEAIEENESFHGGKYADWVDETHVYETYASLGTLTEGGLAALRARLIELKG